jgi:AraC-like DNA-binding protein
VTQRLQTSEPNQEEVADILNTSARTLQRKLGDSGTTFKKILDETRHALALAYMSTPQNSVNEVTHLLGFSCSSSFNRAFRRWTGLSPSEWRAGSTSRYLHSHRPMPPHSATTPAQSANAAYTMSRNSMR